MVNNKFLYTLVAGMLIVGSAEASENYECYIDGYGVTVCTGPRIGAGVAPANTTDDIYREELDKLKNEHEAFNTETFAMACYSKPTLSERRKTTPVDKLTKLKMCEKYAAETKFRMWLKIIETEKMLTARSIDNQRHAEATEILNKFLAAVYGKQDQPNTPTKIRS